MWPLADDPTGTVRRTLGRINLALAGGVCNISRVDIRIDAVALKDFNTFACMG